MIIRGREQECFLNFAESNILAESVAQPLSVWTLMNAHFAIFVINIQMAMGEGVVTGGVQFSHLAHLAFPVPPFTLFSF